MIALKDAPIKNTMINNLFFLIFLLNFKESAKVSTINITHILLQKNIAQLRSTS